MGRVFLDRSVAGGLLEMTIKDFTHRLIRAEFTIDGIVLAVLRWRPSDGLTIRAFPLPPSSVPVAAGFGMLIVHAVRLGDRIEQQGVEGPAEFLKTLAQEHRRLQ
jgi:hypothetical protein